MEKAFGLKMLKKKRFLAFERFDKNALTGCNILYGVPLRPDVSQTLEMKEHWKMIFLNYLNVFLVCI